MAKPKNQKTPVVNPTGLTPSSSDANRSEQAAAVLAQQPGESLATNQGLRISDNQNSLRAGSCGPTLLEDHILREKSCTSITSAFLSGSCMHVARVHTAFLKCTSRCIN